MKTLLLSGFGVILAAAAWLYGPALSVALTSPERLLVPVEQPFAGSNFRDLGASLNSCLGEQRFTEGLVYRANGWFSGGDCRAVGEPEVIYSLNFDPGKGRHSFCRAPGGPVIGQGLNSKTVLADLEFIERWDDPNFRADVCGFFKAGFQSIADGRRTLVHCDAGRDRTGAYSALLAAVIAEEAGFFDDKLIAAVECDYRKSPTLASSKYGRMQTLLQAARQRGGVSQFLRQACQLPADLTTALAHRMTTAKVAL